MTWVKMFHTTYQSLHGGKNVVHVNSIANVNWNKQKVLSLFNLYWILIRAVSLKGIEQNSVLIIYINCAPERNQTLNIVRLYTIVHRDFHGFTFANLIMNKYSNI